MSLALDEGQKRIRKIMVVNVDDNSIGKRINQMVDQCLEIDIRGIENNLKRQRTEEGSGTGASPSAGLMNMSNQQS